MSTETKDEVAPDRVREIREGAGLDRLGLAKKLGVSVYTVESWELARRPCRGPAATLLLTMEVGSVPAEE